ncbi:MAG: alpha-N-arabinofuranosidase [Gemmatimonadaceae bacterium]
MLQRITAAFRLVLGLALVSGTAHAQTINATIDASAKGAPIQPFIYGMFVEHIGGLLEQGFRAEMLDDRKFYYAIGAQTAVGGRGNRGGAPRRWQPVGAVSSVRMDSARAYASSHVPRVSLDSNEPRGISEGNVAIVSGKSYVGRIVISGDPGATVSVSLVWGNSASTRQTVRLSPITTAWKTQQFRFTSPPVSTDSARVEITGTGRGTFAIGAVSLMPSDNMHGFRREVVTALASMHSGVYRFPGGNFVSGPFDWRDAVGDPDKRAPRWDPVWNAVQPNDFGLDEFMLLCKLLDVQPYITVNGGFGDAFSAAQQVEYANGAVTTPMGQRRAANGHPKPYGIKYWGIGNEMWGDWQYGYMSIDQWIAKQGQFAREMRKVDPSIKLVAAGAMPDAMTGSGMAKKLTGKIVAEEMGPADWSAALLSRSINDFEILSQHFYVYGGTHYDLQQGKQVPDDPAMSLVEWARKPASMVRVEYEHFQMYREKIPAITTKPITVAIDEWAYSGSPPNAFKPVLAYAWGLHEMFRHTDVFSMAGFTFAGSTLSATRTDAVLNPIGLMFKLYADHFGKIPLGVGGSSPQPQRTGQVGGEVPNVNAGSPTYPIDVAAALSADGMTLTVAVVNPSETAHQLQLDLRAFNVAGSGKVWRMAPGSVTATNVAGRPPEVRVEELPAIAGEMLTVPAISVGIYSFPLRK